MLLQEGPGYQVEHYEYKYASNSGGNYRLAGVITAVFLEFSIDPGGRAGREHQAHYKRGHKAMITNIYSQ
jgi:hypothetical protein